MKRLGMALCLLVAYAAVARDSEGALDLIRSPHNAWPAVVRPGGQFEAVLRQPAALSLVQPGAAAPGIVLETSATPTGTYRVAIPEGTPAGVYALEAKTGDAVDRTARAVYVLGQQPDAYTVAHIAAPTLGAEDGAVLRTAIEAANRAEAALCIITGSLTASGRPEEFLEFLAILDECSAPTFAVPGPADRAAAHCERYLGDVTRSFWYGPDGYLGIDTSEAVPVDPLGDDLARLHEHRRAIRAARWSVGVTARYLSRMTMRAQLVLFADDPLDYLLASEIEPLAEGSETVLPWPTTVGLVPPPGEPGVLWRVTPEGLSPWVAEPAP